MTNNGDDGVQRATLGEIKKKGTLTRCRIWWGGGPLDGGRLSQSRGRLIPSLMIHLRGDVKKSWCLEPTITFGKKNYHFFLVLFELEAFCTNTTQNYLIF